uniref:Uncharacterized protein n=1 Tax=Anguilla anguilla TaxID=7936 RepID=A0A0E9RAP0_ANGAN
MTLALIAHTGCAKKTKIQMDQTNFLMHQRNPDQQLHQDSREQINTSHPTNAADLLN